MHCVVTTTSYMQMMYRQRESNAILILSLRTKTIGVEKHEQF